MLDKLEIRIPFAPAHVNLLRGDFASGSPSAFVDPLLYDFRLSARSVEPLPLAVSSSGRSVCVVESITTPWDSIPSSFSQMAVGFFPEGQGMYQWPCVVIKCSPSKILQGHNVYGTERPREGVMEMLGLLTTAFPRLAAHLDFSQAELRILDCTYSARMESEGYMRKALDFFARQGDGKCKIHRVESTLYMHVGSDYICLKLYIKALELLEDAKKAKRKGKRAQAELLSKKDLIDFAMGLLRLEATIKAKKLALLGIPLNLWEFLKYEEQWLAETGTTLCERLWRIGFENLLADIEGHTMKNCDDEAVRTAIFAKYTKIRDDGRICRRLANAIWHTFQSIRYTGYATLASAHNATFFRNVGHLEELGYSRAWLRSLDPTKPTENVIPMTRFINIDFGAQRPADYVEPVSRYRHLFGAGSKPVSTVLRSVA